MNIAVGFVLIVVFILVFCGFPTWAKILVFIVNLFVPDPLPFVDEVIMAAITLKDLMD